MESSEHNWANISETICPEMLVFGKQASWMLLFQNILANAIISQINTLLLLYFISYYSSEFTVNQFHNHDAEVYAPQRLFFPNSDRTPLCFHRPMHPTGTTLGVLFLSYNLYLKMLTPITTKNNSPQWPSKKQQITTIMIKSLFTNSDYSKRS